MSHAAAPHPRRVAALTALLVALLLVLPPTSGLLRDGPVRTHLSACIPTGPIRTVADLNRLVRETPGLPSLRGADVGVDTLLPDGRRVWFFADTLQSLGHQARVVRNSALLISAECARVLTGPDRGAPIPDRPDGVGYWPRSVVTASRPAGVTLRVFADRVRPDPDDPLGFQTLGPAVAVFRVAHGRTPRFRRVVDLGPDRPGSDVPDWGAAAARAGGWVYVYGTSTRPIPGVHGFALRVARSRVADVEDPERWAYWDGAAWSADPGRAVALIDEVGGVSHSLSVFEKGGVWWALSKQDEFLGTDLAVWPAPHPWGPFGAATPLVSIPCDPATGRLRYLALAHPELLRRRGTMIVSWSRNDTDLAAVCENPTLYRPRFRRVTLPLVRAPGRGSVERD